MNSIILEISINYVAITACKWLLLLFYLPKQQLRIVKHVLTYAQILSLVTILLVLEALSGNNLLKYSIFFRRIYNVHMYVCSLYTYIHICTYDSTILVFYSYRQRSICNYIKDTISQNCC